MKLEDIHPGMFVKVTGAVPRHNVCPEDGILWHNSWELRMDAAIGRVFEVKASFTVGGRSYGIRFSEVAHEPFGDCAFPWEVLEPYCPQSQTSTGLSE